jgi:hypothetical protein
LFQRSSLNGKEKEIVADILSICNETNYFLHCSLEEAGGEARDHQQKMTTNRHVAG